jgi:hypothetical protein
MQNRTVPFSLSFYTYNQKTGSTGELIKLDKVVRCGLPYADRMDDMGLIGVKKIDDSGHPYAVHTWLIDEFNKKKSLGVSEFVKVVSKDVAMIDSPFGQTLVKLNASSGLQGMTVAKAEPEPGYKYAPWGTDDMMPQNVIKRVKKSTIVGPKLDLMARFLYAGNVAYGNLVEGKKR